MDFFIKNTKKHLLVPLDEVYLVGEYAVSKMEEILQKKSKSFSEEEKKRSENFLRKRQKIKLCFSFSSSSAPSPALKGGCGRKTQYDVKLQSVYVANDRPRPNAFSRDKKSAVKKIGRFGELAF